MPSPRNQALQTYRNAHAQLYSQTCWAAVVAMIIEHLGVGPPPNQCDLLPKGCCPPAAGSYNSPTSSCNQKANVVNALANQGIVASLGPGIASASSTGLPAVRADLANRNLVFALAKRATGGWHTLALGEGDQPDHVFVLDPASGLAATVTEHPLDQWPTRFAGGPFTLWYQIICSMTGGGTP